MAIETLGSLAVAGGEPAWMEPPATESLYEVTSGYPYTEIECEPGAGAPRYGGQKDALQCVAFWACVSIISRTIAQLPKNVMVRGDNGGRSVAEDHPLNYVLHTSANVELTSFEFWERVVVHLMTHGNAFARIRRDSKDRALELELLNPLRMWVTRDYSTGVRVYRYMTDKGDAEYFTDYERTLLHIPAMSDNDLIGISPIQQFAQTIDLANTTETVQAKFFENGALSPAFLSIPGNVNLELQKKMEEAIKSQTGTRTRWGNVLILQNGAKLEPIETNFVNLQLIDLRKFEVEDIARIHGVPLHLIQSLDRATNNNIEHQGIDFATHTIIPICTRIEQRLNMVCLGIRESLRFYTKFNAKGLMRGDAKARGEFYTKMFATGAYSPNNILDLEDEERIPASQGGDTHFIQQGFISLEKAKDVDPMKLAGDAPAAAQEDDPEDPEEDDQ